MPPTVTEALRQEDPTIPVLPPEASQVPPPNHRRETKIEPSILLPLLADQWMGLIDQVVTSHGSAIAPFQIDTAGTTRRFETMIRELDAAGAPQNYGATPLRFPAAVQEAQLKSAAPANARVLEQMNATLQRLTARAVLHGQDLKAAVKEITEIAAETLEAARAGIWVASDDGLTLTCIDLYSRAEKTHSGSIELSAANYPAYFSVLQSQRVIDAPVARRDPQTHEMSECYLVPHGITSCLDAPIRHQGKLTGVICVEHVGPPRQWGGAAVSFIGSLADHMALIAESSERERAEHALKYSHSLLTAAFDAAADGIVIVDSNGILTGSNQRFLELWKLNRDQITGKPVAEILPLFANQVKDSAKFSVEVTSLFADPNAEGHDTIECKDGRLLERTSKPQRLDDKIVGRVCTYRDLTAQRDSEKASQNMEQMLQQGMKLEALGTLAGGIAHDFNNVLTAILGHAELALNQSSEPRVQQSLGEIVKASDRAKNLVKQILTFSRKQEPEKKTQPLRPLLVEVTKLLAATLPSSIEIKTSFDQSPASACVDAAQLHQVVMNLCTNASHAMKEKGGTIRIGEGLIDLSSAAVREYPGLEPGPHVHLWVTDTGTGMSPDTVRRVFEPFFTTKPSGEGTGLGLSVVHGIIQAHRGAITVESKLGQGTTFHIYLPAVKETQSSDASEQVSARSIPKSRGERILFVDDDPSVGTFMRQALEMLDYVVIVFDHPIEALEHFTSQSYDYDLVITDMGLPRINGLELSQRIQKIAPGIPTILLTGSNESPSFPALAKAGIRRVVTKPITCRDLSIVVRDVLDMNRTELETA